MPRVVFTPQLERFVECPPRELDAGTVRELLDGVFADNPRLESYVVDEHGRVRRHVVVFVNGRQIEDRERLSDPVGDDDEVFVMQALSGG